MQDYVDMLERHEDMEDLEMLNEMRNKPLEFRAREKLLGENALTSQRWNLR